MQDVNRKMAIGAAWMILFKITERLIGLVSTIILARLLVPEDFGLIAMAMSVIAVLELLGAFSFDMALIQNQSAERKHYDTAWTFNVIFGVGTALLLMALAGPAASFYEESRLTAVMLCLAAFPLLQGFENIGVVAFRKEMQFDREFNFLLARKVAGFLITIPAALLLRNYWALIIGMLSGRLVSVALSYRLHPYRPRLSLEAAADLFDFSKWLFFNNLLFFAKNNSADFVVGKLAGSGALGVYSVAFQIANLPTTELVAPINRAVFPGYSRLSSNLADLRQGYLNVIGVIAMFALPAGVGIAVTSEALVMALLGPKWMAAAGIIGILAIFGVLTAMQTNMGSVYLALGQPQVSTWLAVAYVAVLLPLLIAWTGPYGAEGAAWAYLVTVAALLPVNLYVLFGRLELRLPEFLAATWRPIAATVLMAVVVHAWLQSADAATGSLAAIPQLLTAVGVGVVTYGLALWGVWRACGSPDGAEKATLDRVRPRIARFLSRKHAQDPVDPR